MENGTTRFLDPAVLAFNQRKMVSLFPVNFEANHTNMLLIEGGKSITLSSRKGPCGVSNNAFSCGLKVGRTDFYLVDGKLSAGDGDQWFATRKPSGTAQETIYTSKHDVGLVVEWRG
jgi:hypothetical protein